MTTAEKVGRFLAFRSPTKRMAVCFTCKKRQSITFDSSSCPSCLVEALNRLEVRTQKEDKCFLCLMAIGATMIKCSSDTGGIQPAHKTCLEEVLTSELTAIMVAIG